MNLFVVVGIFLLLGALLLLLQRLERRIEEAGDDRTLRELAEAKDSGTAQPLTQHPQIDAQACIGCGSCIAACPEDEVLGLVNGVAQVIHGARCIGHGRCAEVCPVAAVKIGLGDVALRPDIPVLSERLETSVPGMFIAGELGGLALIRIAVEQATRAVEAIARDLAAEGRSHAPNGIADVLIAGAGPAGFAASLKALECGLSYVTIDQDDLGGTVRKYPRRKLTLTGPLVLPLHGPVKKEEFLKEELLAFWEEVRDRYRLHIRSGVRLLGIREEAGCFRAETAAGEVSARRVLLALGRRGTPRKLGVPGEDAEKVLYQLVDAASFRGEHVLVAGGGDSAVEAATALASQPGNTVTLSYRRAAFFRLKRRNLERIERFAEEGRIRVLFESQVRAIGPQAVTLTQRAGGAERRAELRNDFVFIFAGGEAPYPLLRSMGVRFNGDSASPPAGGLPDQERVLTGTAG
jgi:thioredoxin reductase